MSNENEIQKMMDNSTLPISDAASFFRYPITRNMKPYEKVVRESNNRMVDSWENEVLKKIGLNGGRIAAGKVGPSWSTYYEGRSIRQLAHHMDMLPRATPQQLDFWLHFFDNNDVEKLNDCGLSMVSLGWALVMNELRLHFAEEKYEKVYDAEDPLEWDKAANLNPKLMKGETMPFWDEEKFRDIQEKVMTVLNNRVVPRMV